MKSDELIEWGKNTANEATDCASVQLQTKEGDGKYLQGYCKAMMDFVSVIEANRTALEADEKLYANALIDLLTVISIASDDGYDFPPTSKMLTAKADKIALKFCAQEAE